MSAQALIDDYLAGGSLISVAERHQLSEKKAWLVIHGCGIENPAAQSRAAREEAKQIIIEKAASHASVLYKLRPGAIWRSPKLKPVVRARFIAFLVAYELGCSLKAIGRAFEMDHTSVLHGRNRALELAQTDALFAERLNAVRLMCAEARA